MTAARCGLRVTPIEVTVKLTPLLGLPPTFTITLPVVAFAGTGATIVVWLQLVVGAGVPLKVTVPVPGEDPKFVPVIVTGVPTAPEVGDRLVMVGEVTPPPAAARKATICMTHQPDAVSGADALKVPVEVTI